MHFLKEQSDKDAVKMVIYVCQEQKVAETGVCQWNDFYCFRPMQMWAGCAHTPANLKDVYLA